MFVNIYTFFIYFIYFFLEILTRAYESELEIFRKMAWQVYKRIGVLNTQIESDLPR